MQESSGTRQEKFSVLMCCKGLQLHRERSPSDPRLGTCTGSPKGAQLVPREIDLLSFFLFFSHSPSNSNEEKKKKKLFHSQLLLKKGKKTHIG